MNRFDHRDILLKAASRIEEEGMWCQRKYFDEDQVTRYNHAFDAAEQIQRLGVRVPECALAALASATVELGLRFEDWSKAVDIFDRTLDKFSVASFNDALGRTAHEVAEAMRGAAL